MIKDMTKEKALALSCSCGITQLSFCEKLTLPIRNMKVSFFTDYFFLFFFFQLFDE